MEWDTDQNTKPKTEAKSEAKAKPKTERKNEAKTEPKTEPATPPVDAPNDEAQPNAWAKVVEFILKYKFWVMLAGIALLGLIFIVLMRYWFDNSEAFKGLFAAVGNDVVGEAGPDTEAALAERARTTALVSMYIFAVITVLQFVALGVGIYVVQGIRAGEGSAALKLKQLENAEVFFDIPLYVGLFGTVSAFLVMTFSPQSSRLIAYSSTLIGIIFSLVLRLTLQYPLRKRLIADKPGEEK